jgi:hypothetical protein
MAFCSRLTVSVMHKRQLDKKLIPFFASAQIRTIFSETAS